MKAHSDSHFNTLELDMNDSNIDFNFTWFRDFKNGIGGYESIHNITGQIQATTNWKLNFRSQGQFKRKRGRGKIALNNVGVTAKYTGSGKVQNRANSNPLVLSSRSKTILSSYYSSQDFKNKKQHPHKEDKWKQKGNNGKGNAYGHDKDKHKKKITDPFTIYFEMGTQKAGMNPKSLYKQKLQSGTYSVKINFVISEKL